MDRMINFGIDLGTTNSLIARFTKGSIEVFKEPTGLKETLPSVVGFRKDRILVGDKAREYLEKDSKSVVGSFKRKMGTTEAFKIKSLNQSKTPVDLSAYVLKELKTFVHTGETPDATVITVPASFDIIQSNATKEAGYQAGFKQVILLQEPIAASLAYANKKKEKNLKNSQWIVYDLGGGTFDVALIRIQEGEMKVLDHEGDNFLGGSDFDQRIVEQVVVPYLENNGAFENLETHMKSADGKHNSKWYVALRAVEEAKKELSTKSSAEIEFSITDDDGETIDAVIPIARSEFEGLIKDYIDRTASMIKMILTRASLRPQDIDFVLMVGGSTYIPYVRKRVEELMQIPVNCDIEPTTAIVIGAAYYAGTREKQLDASADEKKKNAPIKIRTAYQKVSQDDVELFAARVEGNLSGLFYSITRDDGGFSTGLKTLAARINEDLPLVKDSYNAFTLKVYDGRNNPIETDVDLIAIAHGFSPPDQPLSHDICIEVDDFENNSTKLELVFSKNSVLPLKKTLTKTITKTIIKGSADEMININILEGPHFALPAANQTIGYMTISGRQITRDVIKGSDLEISLELSESRDLKVSAYIPMTDQTFEEVFKPMARNVPVAKLREEIETLRDKSEHEMKEAVNLEEYEQAKELDKQKKLLDILHDEANRLSASDVTDARYQMEAKKRRIAQDIDSATKGKRLATLKADYTKLRDECVQIVNQDGNDHERKRMNEIIAREDQVVNSISPIKIQEILDDLNRLKFTILWRNPQFLIGAFEWLTEQRQKFNDQRQVKSLLEAGQLAVNSQNYDRLSEIVRGLFNLLPQDEQEKARAIMGIK